jgi:hypothetical protein
MRPVTAPGILAVLLVVSSSPVTADRKGPDPLGFPGDDAVITENVTAHMPDTGAVTAHEYQQPAPSTASTASSLSLQVQFYASPDIAKARDVKSRAEANLPDSITLIYETPYYKLRTGDFRDYDQAEHLAVRLRAMGYETAWVVRVDRARNPRATGE